MNCSVLCCTAVFVVVLQCVVQCSAAWCGISCIQSGGSRHRHAESEEDRLEDQQGSRGSDDGEWLSAEEGVENSTDGTRQQSLHRSLQWWWRRWNAGRERRWNAGRERRWNAGRERSGRVNEFRILRRGMVRWEIIAWSGKIQRKVEGKWTEESGDGDG